MITRRRLLEAAGTGAVVAVAGRDLSRTSVTPAFVTEAEAQAAGLSLPAQLPQGTRQEAVLEALPSKQPLIKLSYRPPNYETPIELLRTAITPNDAFFVRYHLSDIPEVSAQTWRLSIGGEGANGETSPTFDELKRLPAVEGPPGGPCSGNPPRRHETHLAGVPSGH